MSIPNRLRLSSQTDVACAVPYLMGFYPHDSLVALGIGAPDGGTWVSRVDLDTGPDTLTAMADHAARVKPEKLILVGFGTPERVNPVITVFGGLLTDRDVAVRDALRVHDGRWWSLTCTNPDCCPAEGTPYDAGSNRAAAQAVVAGLGVLPDRAALEQTLEPIGSASIRQASIRAERRLITAITTGEPAIDITRRLVREGIALLGSILEAAPTGELPDEDTIAWLSMLLYSRYIRDQAIALIDAASEEPSAQVRLWTEMSRRIIERYAAAPTCLAAYAAWRCGHGPLAHIAVDRVLKHHPDYSMARLLREVLAADMPAQKVPPFPAAAIDAGLPEALPTITQEFQHLTHQIQRRHRALNGAPGRRGDASEAAPIRADGP